MAAEPSVSEATQECIECHTINHPGIVEDWRNSRHAIITPGQAMKVKGFARKVSSPNVSDSLQSNVVGCAECHTLRPEAHADTFEHNGYDIHVVVSPDDCQTCHQEERKQYADNVMAYAYNMLGYALMELEQFEKAEQAFDAYIKISPNTANPFDSKGDYFMRTKQFELAYKSYMRAYEIDPTFVVSRKKAQKAEHLLKSLKES